jgi:hypothetical protein
MKWIIPVVFLAASAFAVEPCPELSYRPANAAQLVTAALDLQCDLDAVLVAAYELDRVATDDQLPEVLIRVGNQSRQPGGPMGALGSPRFRSHSSTDNIFRATSWTFQLNPEADRTTPVYLIHGWALDRAGMRSVELWIDGKREAFIDYTTAKQQAPACQPSGAFGIPRPDIEALFPQYKEARAGFCFEVSLLGTHSVEVRLINSGFWPRSIFNGSVYFLPKDALYFVPGHSYDGISVYGGEVTNETVRPKRPARQTSR